MKVRFESTNTGTKTTWEFSLTILPDVGDKVTIDAIHYTVLKREFYPQYNEVYISLKRK